MKVVRGLRPLKITEIPDCSIFLSVDFVAHDEVFGNQLIQERNHVHRVGREQPHLEALWLPFEHALVVGLNAKAEDTQARFHAHRNDVLVGEEAGMYGSDAAHAPSPEHQSPHSESA